MENKWRLAFQMLQDISNLTRVFSEFQKRSQTMLRLAIFTIKDGYLNMIWSLHLFNLTVCQLLIHLGLSCLEETPETMLIFKWNIIELWKSIKCLFSSRSPLISSEKQERYHNLTHISLFILNNLSWEISELAVSWRAQYESGLLYSVTVFLSITALVSHPKRSFLHVTVKTTYCQTRPTAKSEFLSVLFFSNNI